MKGPPSKITQSDEKSTASKMTSHVTKFEGATNLRSGPSSFFTILLWVFVSLFVFVLLGLWKNDSVVMKSTVLSFSQQESRPTTSSVGVNNNNDAVLFSSPIKEENNTEISLPRPPESNETTHHHQQSIMISSSTTTSSIVKNAVKKKTYLIVHVGPPKTGTTTIQSIADNSTRELQMNNYIYGGRYKGTKLYPLRDAFLDYDCATEVHNAVVHNSSSKPTCWMQIEKDLTDYKGKNIFISDEYIHLTKLFRYTPNWWIAFQELLDKLGFKFRIIMTYRRLYEWLISRHGQRYKLSKPNLWEWPIKGNKTYVAVTPIYPLLLSNIVLDNKFDDWSIWDKRVSTLRSKKHSYMERWLPPYIHALPPNVDRYIFNFHGIEPMDKRFYCEVLPGATHICNKLKNAKNPKFANQGQHEKPVFDVLSVAAADAGLIDKSRYRRMRVRNAAASYNEVQLNQTTLDLPYLCPTDDETSMILNASLYWEKEFVPSMDDEASHRAGVWDYLEKKKFCDLDTERVLQLPEWLEFFKQFSKQTKPTKKSKTNDE